MSATDSATSEVEFLRQQLTEYRFYIEDAELRQRVTAWIDESGGEAQADSLREHMDNRLTALLAEYPMYHAPTLDRGADGFPDKCSDCRHYGAACPVLRNQIEVRWRDRKLAQANGDSAVRAIYQQQANDVRCQRIPEWLAEWDEDQRPFVERGRELLAEVEEHLAADTVDTDANVPAGATPGDAGEAGGED